MQTFKVCQVSLFCLYNYFLTHDATLHGAYVIKWLQYLMYGLHSVYGLIC